MAHCQSRAGRGGTCRGAACTEHTSRPPAAAAPLRAAGPAGCCTRRAVHLEVEPLVGLHVDVQRPDVAVGPAHLGRAAGVPVAQGGVAAHNLVHLPKIELQSRGQLREWGSCGRSAASAWWTSPASSARLLQLSAQLGACAGASAGGSCGAGWSAPASSHHCLTWRVVEMCTLAAARHCAHTGCFKASWCTQAAPELLDFS